MANLIVTIISIVLAVALGAAVAYYAGTAYQSHQDKAFATIVLNQSQQVEAGWTAYITANLNMPPTDWSALIGDNIFNDVLTFPKTAGVTSAQYQIWPDNSGEHYYLVADAGDPSLGNGNLACDAILQSALGVVLDASYIPPAISDFNASTLSHIGLYTCGPFGAGPTGTPVLVNGVAPVFFSLDHNIFVYRLS